MLKKIQYNIDTRSWERTKIRRHWFFCALDIIFLNHPFCCIDCWFCHLFSSCCNINSMKRQISCSIGNIFYSFQAFAHIKVSKVKFCCLQSQYYSVLYFKELLNFQYQSKSFRLSHSSNKWKKNKIFMEFLLFDSNATVGLV